MTENLDTYLNYDFAQAMHRHTSLKPVMVDAYVFSDTAEKVPVLSALRRVTIMANRSEINDDSARFYGTVVAPPEYVGKLAVLQICWQQFDSLHSSLLLEEA